MNNKMEKEESIKRLVNLAFGKKFSEEGRYLFGNWLRAEADAEEKEQVLEQLWNRSEGVLYASTHSDWKELRAKLSPTPAKTLLWQRTWVKYAAAVLLIIASSALTWMLKNENIQGTVSMQECLVANGEEKELILDDGTKVWVNAGSMLIYPQSFAHTSERMVYLVGEAHFKVAKNKEKTFIVSTSQLDVQALGTSFTVEAYQDDPMFRATLEEGSILVDAKTSGEQPVILNPNEQLIYNSEDKSVSVQTVDIETYNMTRKGYLIFKNATIHQLVNDLQRKYAVTVRCDFYKFAEERYNVKFAPHESLQDVVNVLNNLQMSCCLKDDTLVIK